MSLHTCGTLMTDAFITIEMLLAEIESTMVLSAAHMWKRANTAVLWGADQEASSNCLIRWNRAASHATTLRATPG